MNETHHTIICECSSTMTIEDNHFEEVAEGVWGTINCPGCGIRLNDKIKSAYKLFQSAKNKVQ